MRAKVRLLFLYFIVAMIGVLWLTAPVYAEDTLEKIEKKGQVVMGHREGAIPFGFYNKAGEWVGFSMDIGKALHKALEDKFNKPIKYVKKPINPKTRIPLVANRTIDIVIGGTTITLARHETIDFSIPFFLTGSRLLVPKGSPIRDHPDLADKRVGVPRGGTATTKVLIKSNEDGMINPPCKLTYFDDTTKGFLALRQGKIHAFAVDASMLEGMRLKAPNPENWEIVGRYLTYDPYGMIVRENDSDWLNFVNEFMIRFIRSGEYFKLYDKWMGPKGEVPIPMSPEFKAFLNVYANFPD